MNTAKIRVKGLELRTVIGVSENERLHKQKIIADIEMVVDVSKAIETDNVEDSANYEIICRSILEETEKTEFHLLENLADFILGLVMEEEKVIQTTVAVTKPSAVRFSKSVSVELSAERY